MTGMLIFLDSLNQKRVLDKLERGGRFSQITQHLKRAKMMFS